MENKMADPSKKTFWDIIPSYEVEWGHLKWKCPVDVMIEGSPYSKCGKQLLPVNTPNGKVWALTFFDSSGPPYKTIEVTDAKVLEKLRSIKGQEPFSHGEWPIFWHENLETVQ
jgi:hypothetical protein